MSALLHGEGSQQPRGACIGTRLVRSSATVSGALVNARPGRVRVRAPPRGVGRPFPEGGPGGTQGIAQFGQRLV